MRAGVSARQAVSVSDGHEASDARLNGSMIVVFILILVATTVMIAALAAAISQYSWMGS
jgi:hypothetical protein